MSSVLVWIISIIVLIIAVSVQEVYMKRIKSDWNLVIPVICILIMTGLFISHVLCAPVFILFIIISGTQVFRLSHGEVKNYHGRLR